MMRAAFYLGTVLAAAGLVLLVLAEAPLMRLAIQAQATFQNALADLLRALRAGDATALAGLLAVTFAYGFLHAAGPGHGKALLAGYGVARRVPVLRLAGLALAAALAQAATAVLIVHGAALTLDLTRARLLQIETDVVPVFANAAMALIGVWLVVRGLAALRRRLWVPAMALVAAGPAAGDAAGAAPVVCGDCGHRHGPSLSEVAALRSPWEAAMLIAAIAARPCSGALILLFLTLRMDIAWAGILAVVTMALGTALVTGGVALLAALSREGVLGLTDRLGRTRSVLPLLELGVGLVVVWLALRGLWLGV